MEWAFGAVVVVVGGLWLWAMLGVERGISKDIQPFIDDFFGNYPRKRKPDKTEGEIETILFLAVGGFVSRWDLTFADEPKTRHSA